MTLNTNVETWERIASLVIGLSLVALAARRKQFFGGAAMTGWGLVARGASGFCPVNASIGRGLRPDDTRAALGGPRGVRIQERVRINRPREEVFGFWRELENLPRFLRHVERIDVLDSHRSHWVVKGPAGMTFEWDAEIINEIEPQLIGWRSLEGSTVHTAGSVRFAEAGRNSTDLIVTLQYDPPGGRVGAKLAQVIGSNPEVALREDLQQLKQMLER